jgi:uroporphyrinogen decarboxylase
MMTPANTATLKMTNKDLLLNSIFLNSTPRPPAIILSGGVWANKQIGLSLEDSFHLDPKVNADNIIKMNEKLNSDLIWTAAGCNNLVLRAIGAKTTFDKVGIAASIDETLITEAEDVDNLSLDGIENDPGIYASLETTRILKDHIGAETLIGISQWGPLTLAGLLIGTEDMMIMSMRDQPALQHIMEFTEKLVVKYWSLFLEAGAELVSQAEPSASCDMISPKQFAKIAVPSIQNTNNAIGDKPLVKMLHICGNITKILDYLPETGSHLISFDHKVDLKTAREKLGGKMAFAGKLDPVGVIQNRNPADIETLTRQYVEEAGDEGGYIVMPGCDLPPASPIENIQAMIKTAKSIQY